jgi:hypothetical protein
VELNINHNFGKPSWTKGKKFSDDHRAKLSQAKKGKSPPNKGKPMPEHQRIKLSLDRKDKMPKSFSKEKVNNNKKWLIFFEDGKIKQIENSVRYCQENNLSYHTFRNVYRKRQKRTSNGIIKIEETN